MPCNFTLSKIRALHRYELNNGQATGEWCILNQYTYTHSAASGISQPAPNWIYWDDFRFQYVSRSTVEPQNTKIRFHNEILSPKTLSDTTHKHTQRETYAHMKDDEKLHSTKSVVIWLIYSIFMLQFQNQWFHTVSLTHELLFDFIYYVMRCGMRYFWSISPHLIRRFVKLCFFPLFVVDKFDTRCRRSDVHCTFINLNLLREPKPHTIYQNGNNNKRKRKRKLAKQTNDFFFLYLIWELSICVGFVDIQKRCVVARTCTTTTSPFTLNEEMIALLAR